MATIALHSASTGLSALSTQIDVIANNLANVNTPGYKAARVNFEDLLYQEKRQPGVENAQGDRTPAGLQVGLGVRVSNTTRDFSKGTQLSTSNQTDLMIEGPGFFPVAAVVDGGNATAYTRAGNFFVNTDGELVLGNIDGPRLEPPITLPPNHISVSVSADGIVSYTTSDDPTSQQAGQIELTSFVNPNGMRPIGGNLFVPTEASGDPLTGVPGQEGRGVLRQNALEGSNVEPVRELVELIKAQRAFEMNSQTISAADQALQVVSNLGR